MNYLKQIYNLGSQLDDAGLKNPKAQQHASKLLVYHYINIYAVRYFDECKLLLNMMNNTLS